jgi:hypothetical protein
MLKLQHNIAIIMTMPADREHKSETAHRSGLHAITAACLIACCSAIAFADDTAANPDAAPAFVDSVDSWGTWELGIEPAAGPQVVTSHVMPVHSASVQFRPNDNAAFRPNGVPVNDNISMPSNPPAPVPTIPPGTTQGAIDAPPPTGDPRNR